MNVLKRVLFFSLILISLTTVSCTKKNGSEKSSEKSNEVIVYTYDSFTGEWGPGAALEELFEKRTGNKVTFVDCGDAIQAYNKAVLEKDSPYADIVLGVDNTLSEKAERSGIFEMYRPKDADKIIKQELQDELSKNNYLTPYDYSHFTVIYNSESGIEKPLTLLDLTKDIYRKKIILIDPRTATPGRLFLAWTEAVFDGSSEQFASFWRGLKPNILTMPASWSEAWGMFLNHEAPFVISYTTSPAVCIEYDNVYENVSLLFDEGHILQVEGCGLLKNAPHKEAAKAFIDFLITKEAQDTLPLTQWMYPVNSEVVLPESYAKGAPVPKKTLPFNSAKTDEAEKTVMQILSE